MTTDSRAKTALVTGGNKGIGLAISRGLARAGFVVFLGSRDLGRGIGAAGSLAPDGDVRPVQLDVTAQASIDAAVSRVGSETEHLDVLVNNAGVNVGSRRPMDHLPVPTEETIDDIRFVYETNVFAVVAMIRSFLPLLRRASSGRIVNVTSKRGSLGEEGAWAGQPSMSYSSSKTALNAVTAHFARQLAPEGILVNGAAPGHVATGFNGFRGVRTPDEGAAVAIRLAQLAPGGPAGVVFEDDTQLAW